MNMLSISGANLPPELTDVCDAILMPVSLTLPDIPGTPLVYANQPFEYLTGKQVHQMLGLNHRFLRGPKTDASLSEEMEIAVARNQRVAACMVSYRDDGTHFYHLFASQPLETPNRQMLSIACHAAFTPFIEDDCITENANVIDQAWRGIRQHNRLSANFLTVQDTFRLEAISMRFEAVFTRAHNALIRRASADMSTFLKYAAPAPALVGYGSFTDESLGETTAQATFDLGPLSRAPSTMRR